jgi:hypothetical protein
MILPESLVNILASNEEEHSDDSDDETELEETVSGNVRSLRNKMDELTALTHLHYAYREASLICLTETWLQ